MDERILRKASTVQNASFAGRRSWSKQEYLLLVLLLLGGGCLFYFLYLPNYVHTPRKGLEGVVLAEIQVNPSIGGASPPGGFYQDKLKKSPSPKPTPTPTPTPTPVPLLNPVTIPGLEGRIAKDLQFRAEEGGIPMIKKNSSAEASFDNPGPPPADTRDASVLVVTLETYKHGGNIYHRVELALQQPVYLSSGAPSKTSVERAAIWHSERRNFALGTPEKDAEDVIRTEVDEMMDSFLQNYNYENTKK